MPIPSPAERSDHYDEPDELLGALRLGDQVGKYLIQSVAEVAEDHIIGWAIDSLKNTLPGLLEGQGAQNLWDEICAQIQNGSSFNEMYAETIQRRIENHVEQLPEAERAALWLTTYWGECFMDSPPHAVKIPMDIPIKNEEIAKHLVQAMLNEAMNYENEWIQEMVGR